VTIALTSNDALDLLSGLILEDGCAWADVAEDAQWLDALAILDLDSQTPYHFLTRARGRSKTTDLAAIALVVMLTQARPGDRLYALAVDKAQGGLLVDAIRGFVQRTPGLAAVLRVGQYKVTAPGDVTLEVLAADADGRWGLRPAFLIVGEIAWWPDTPTAHKLWEATSTAMHKVPGSRMVVLTTAGDPAHYSYDIRARAERSVLWRLHEIPGPPPWADPARLDDERESLTDSSWRRLFMNEWTAGDDRFTNHDDVAACLRHDGTLAPVARTDYTIGVDLGLVDDPTVAVVAHAEHAADDNTGVTSTFVVVDHIEVWAGSHAEPVPLDEVEAWLRDTAGRYDHAEIVMDSWQGAGMAQRLRANRLSVTDIAFSAQVNDRLARTMLPLLRGHRLALPHDDDLVDELVNLRIVERSPGQYRIDHAPNRHNDRAIAIALAAQHLLNKAPRRKVEIIV
jgi:hypothetical protein